MALDIGLTSSAIDMSIGLLATTSLLIVIL